LEWFFDSRPEWLVVPVFAENPHDPTVGSQGGALVDSGSSGSYIRRDFAVKELQLLALPDVKAEISLPAIRPGEEPQKIESEVFRVQLNFVDKGRPITKSVELIGADGLLVEEAMVLLGMDFLRNVNFSYFIRPRGTVFRMTEPRQKS
jgi:hypothetical protein